MAESGPALPIVEEETERLEWFEAFMRRRCPALLMPPSHAPLLLNELLDWIWSNKRVLTPT